MSKKIVFGELSAEWLNLKKYSIKYPTYIRYKNIIMLYLNDYFYQKNLESCTEEDICNLFHFLSESKLLSSSVLKSVSYILKNILEYGEKTYQLKHFNFSYIRISNYKQEITVLTNFEEQKLLEYCIGRNNMTTLAIYISLYTGLRLGEICGLKWQDVDLDKGYINISRTVQRIEYKENGAKTRKIVLEPKTQFSKRTVVMCDTLIAYIQKYKYATDTNSQQFFLISNSLNIPEPRNIQRNFKRICKILKIDINFHILRHTFATNCVKYGIDVKTLCELLGHSNISTTLNLYVHPTLEYKREQINKFFR